MPPMIIIPMNTAPSRCPKCRQIEHKVEICAHCEYHYPEDQYEHLLWPVCVLIDIGLFFGFFRALFWFSEKNMTFEWWSIPTFLLGAITFLVAGAVPWVFFSKPKNGKREPIFTVIEEEPEV